MGHMVNSQMMPEWAATIMGRAHLTMWEQLLNEFSKSWAELIVTCIHATMVGVTHDWMCRGQIQKQVMGMGDGDR